MHPTVAALAGIPHTPPMLLGGPDLTAGAAAAGAPRLEQAFGTDLSPLFDQAYDERRSLMHPYIYKRRAVACELIYGTIDTTL